MADNNAGNSKAEDNKAEDSKAVDIKASNIKPSDIKMRAQFKDGITEVKMLMTHPMETGRRKNDLDEIVPAHFIQLVTVTLNGTPVLEAQWGTGVSKNPYLTLRLNSAKVGDVVAVSWRDNLGASGNQQIAVIEV